MSEEIKTKQTDEARLNGYFTFFQTISRFAAKEPLAVFSGAMLIIMLMSLWFGYQFIDLELDRQRQELERITNAVDPDEGLVEDRLTLDAEIIQILENGRDGLGADRFKLFQFHNGKKSIADIPFNFASVTHEASGVGVSSEINRLQDVPSSVFARLPSQFRETGVYCGFSEKQLTLGEAPGGVAELLDSQNIKAFCLYGVYKNGNLIGVLSANWVISEPEYESMEDDGEFLNRNYSFEMRNASRSITQLLFAQSN